MSKYCLFVNIHGHRAIMRHIISGVKMGSEDELNEAFARLLLIARKIAKERDSLLLHGKRRRAVKASDNADNGFKLLVIQGGKFGNDKKD